jgi:hypothetical protein
MDVGQPIDAGAILPDGTRFAGLPGLQRSCSITANSSWKPSPRG